MTPPEFTGISILIPGISADTGEGPDVKNANDFYVWGGLLSFIALMEEGYFFNK